MMIRLYRTGLFACFLLPAIQTTGLEAVPEPLAFAEVYRIEEVHQRNECKQCNDNVKDGLC